jgi:hypothetical protein
MFGGRRGENVAALVGAFLVVMFTLVLLEAAEDIAHYAAEWSWPCPPCDER